jgi:hypothetical protein
MLANPAGVSLPDQIRVSGVPAVFLQQVEQQPAQTE